MRIMLNNIGVLECLFVFLIILSCVFVLSKNDKKSAIGKIVASITLLIYFLASF